jgi:hypothetical protein
MRLHQLKVEFDAEEDRPPDARIHRQQRRSAAVDHAPLRGAAVGALDRLRAIQSTDRSTRRRPGYAAHSDGIRAREGTEPSTFSKAYEEVQRVHPLGDAPLLVSRLQRRPADDGRMVLGLLPAEGQGIFLTLDTTLLHGLMKLLQRAVEKAEWGFTLNLPAAQSDPEQGSPTLN